MMQWIRTIGRLLVFPPVLFCLLLAWLYGGTTWYPAATLQLSGTVGDIEKRLDIWWDSGQGLNGYEWEKFRFEPLPPYGADGLALRITRTGTRNGASADKKVVLSGIAVDGRDIDLDGLALGPGLKKDGNRIVFNEDGASLALTIRPTASLQLEFPKFNYAGEVDVHVAGTTTRYDLYAGNNETQWQGRHAAVVQSWFVGADNGFSISMPLPRYPVKALRIAPSDSFQLASATIITEDGQTFTLDGGTYQNGYILSLADVDTQRQRHFHPHRLLFQAIFAAAAAWLVSGLFGYARRFSGPKDIFINEGRSLFWMMLVISGAIFFFWHLSVWPAVMSNDSLEVWRAAQIPGTYLGDHPPLNVIFYLLLGLLWNNPAIVPFTQNLLTSLLIATIFFTLYRNGLPRWVMLCCFALAVTSIPVGLYTTILWKDVPFALLTVLLGFQLALLYREKRQNTLVMTWRRWLLLLGITAAIIGFRHNGILYLFLVPAILVLFGIVRLRFRSLAIMTTLVVVFGLFFFLHPKNSSTADYLVAQTKVYLQQALKKPALEYAKQSSRTYLGIFDVNQKQMQWDLVHLCMYGRYTNDFIKSLRWHDVYAYLPFPKQPAIDTARKAAWTVYLKSYQVPWVYVSWNPVFMLLLLPLLPLLFRVLPMSAVFSLSIFAPVAILVFLSIFNWRYYYFAHVACYFLVPMIITDLMARRKHA